MDSWDDWMTQATGIHERDLVAVERGLQGVKRYRRRRVWVRATQIGTLAIAVLSGYLWGFSSPGVEAQLAYDAYSEAAGAW